MSLKCLWGFLDGNKITGVRRIIDTDDLYGGLQFFHPAATMECFCDPIDAVLLGDVVSVGCGHVFLLGRSKLLFHAYRIKTHFG